MAYRLLLIAIFQDALDYTTTIWVCSQVIHLAIERLHNELNQLRRYFLDALLDNMISVLILNTFHDIAIQFLDHFGLLLNVDYFKRLDGGQELPRRLEEEALVPFG